MPELMQVQSDGQITATGTVAARLLQHDMSLGALRTNDVLRRDEWKHFDDRLIDIARAQLRGVADLFSAGLTYKIGNPLGKTRVEWERVGDMDPAELSMSGVTPGRNDRITFDNKAVPLPIIHKDFNLNIRNLAASRERGESLDTTQIELCTRKVAESMESLLFKGATMKVNGADIPGYFTAPSKKSVTLASGWDNSTATGETILGDILKMIDTLQTAGNNMFGPYVLYVPLEYHLALQKDFKTNSDKSILSRIMEIDLLSSIRFSQELSGGTSGKVLMVQMTRDVIDWVDGMQPALIQWESHGGMVVNFKVMAIGVPRVRDTKTGQSGICLGSV